MDRFGNEAAYAYDSFNRLVATTLPTVQNENGLPITPTISKEYDHFGNAIGQIDARGLRTSRCYNAYGKPILIDHPNGLRERLEYNTDGTVAKEIAADGLQTVYTRDAMGQITQKAADVSVRA